MTNYIKYSDVVLTIIIGIIVALGFLFELAGETVPGWHTISWWAHRDKRLRIVILLGGTALMIFLVFLHFASNNIYR